MDERKTAQILRNEASALKASIDSEKLKIKEELNELQV